MTRREARTEILIVGAGVGGVAGALAACKLGKRVILTEETDWIGGQLTSQAVPPDEHPWIESHGCTASYREFRERVRGWYRRNYPLLPQHRNDPRLNPGGGWVSQLCHEPRVALAVLHEMLAPWVASGQLTLWEETIPVAVETDGDRFASVTLRDLQAGNETVVTTPYVLDATELGDLLALGKVEHMIGAEGQHTTDELHAPPVADPLDQQAISWCFAIDHLEGEDFTIDKPDQYDFWKGYQAPFWPGPQLGWVDIDPETLQPRIMAIFKAPVAGDPPRDFWHYRRILDKAKYPDGTFASDITLVNWPQIDYWLGPLLGVDDEARVAHLEGARQLSRSLLYWMQTEAPRHDGGYGYPGLRLRSDVTGTKHGLAKSVYIRESRRIEAEFTVVEGHVGVEQRAGQVGAETFHDSVGIGSYRIDLHPSTALRTYVDISSWPFQIPLGALIPKRVENLLPANKNLGTTHITNGCYRLHPVEWNIGEAAGALAACCLTTGESPRAIRNTPKLVADFQALLIANLGFELDWPSIRPR
ncbi:MAG: FAD-dependent oxidoreductase [Chloroflexota bacterium]|nr:FAD-dependent oxidoreductase [Chloroflexota bacterium]